MLKYHVNRGTIAMVELEPNVLLVCLHDIIIYILFWKTSLGTFGWRYGLNTSDCSGLCPAGFYCPSYLTPQPGAPSITIWPGKSHINATTLQCGGVQYYCPKGSFYPQIVQGGYYSIGGGINNLTRTDQVICAKGSYCVGAISYLCPPKTYGNSTGLANAKCSGKSKIYLLFIYLFINVYRCLPGRISMSFWNYWADSLCESIFFCWSNTRMHKMSGKCNNYNTMSQFTYMLFSCSLIICNNLVYFSYII